MSPANYLRQGSGGPPKLHAKAEAGYHNRIPEDDSAAVVSGSSRTERGAALVMAILIVMVVGALAAVLIAIVTTETALSASFRHAREVAYGAESSLDLAIHDLATTADWSTVLAAPPANRTSSLSDSLMSPRVPDGRVLDLASLTTTRQRESDMRDGPARFGANVPLWRLYFHANAADVLPPSHPTMPLYLIAWVADDGLDGDGNPFIDTNQTIVVHAEAYGGNGSRRAIEATLVKKDGAVRVATWREWQ